MRRSSEKKPLPRTRCQDVELKRRERQVLDKTDDELVELRDQLGETRAEDHAMLVEHMTRIAATENQADARSRRI